jgi:hypothetical protein
MNQTLEHGSDLLGIGSRKLAYLLHNTGFHTSTECGKAVLNGIHDPIAEGAIEREVVGERVQHTKMAEADSMGQEIGTACNRNAFGIEEVHQQPGGVSLNVSKMVRH